MNYSLLVMESAGMMKMATGEGSPLGRVSGACCEKLRFVRSIYPNLPLMGQNLYHGMLMPLHDSMPSFMNFRRVLHLLEFKKQVSQCLLPSDGGRLFDIHYHFLHGT